MEWGFSVFGRLLGTGAQTNFIFFMQLMKFHQAPEKRNSFLGQQIHLLQLQLQLQLHQPHLYLYRNQNPWLSVHLSVCLHVRLTVRTIAWCSGTTCCDVLLGDVLTTSKRQPETSAHHIIDWCALPPLASRTSPDPPFFGGTVHIFGIRNSSPLLVLEFREGRKRKEWKKTRPMLGL